MNFLPWLHLMGVASSLGSGIFFVFVLYPAASTFDREQRLKIIISTLKYFHPLFLLGICTIFMTGAMHLTDLKISGGALYYSLYGKTLMWKFLLITVIFMLASMQCFGVGLKLTRMANGVIPGDLDLQEKYVRKMKKIMTWNLFFLAIALMMGLRLQSGG